MNTLTGIVKTVNENDFIDAFAAYNRADNFSYEGKKALFEMLEQLADDMGEPIELDIISLCCEFNELSFADFYDEYYMNISGLPDDSEYNSAIGLKTEYSDYWKDNEADIIYELLEYLQDNTSMFYRFDDEKGVDSVIFQAF